MQSWQPVTYLSMGNVLQEHTNLTGAIQFYNYALVLHPDYKEALQSLLIVKCFKVTGKRADGVINPDAEKTLEKIVGFFRLKWVTMYVI